MSGGGAPLWDRLAQARVIDLAHGMKRGIPVSPNHPPYQMALLRRHGDMVRPDGSSAANEVIVTGGHVGTHIDALAHVSHEGRLHGGVDAASVTSHEGFAVLGIDTFPPLACRGVLLDVAALHGVPVLEPGYEVTAEDLAAAEERTGTRVRPGDAVLIRTGWSAYYDEPERFLGQTDGAPGPGEAAARWLAERRVAVTGAETIAYEVIRPGAGHAVLPVHRILLVEAGINIIEVMDLRGLADRSVFGFVAAPLKLVGATGSPLRPLALVD
ncbi:MAG: cyclase family protein [Micromonosporaceae bacterium]|jgi:kynurenine formamidase